MKKVKVYTVEALEKRITKALKKVKFGYQEGCLIEATDAEFSIYNFNTALCNLQQKGVVVTAKWMAKKTDKGIKFELLDSNV